MRWQTGLGEEQLMNALKATTILAALLVSGATVAHAGSIGTVTYTGYTVNPNYTATITDTTLHITNEAGLAGPITLQIPNLGTQILFCVDITDTLLNSGTYTVYTGSGITDTNLAGTSQVTGTSKVNDIATLIATYGTAAQTSAVQAAGLQEAIWADEYATGVSKTSTTVTSFSGITLSSNGDPLVNNQVLTDLSFLLTNSPTGQLVELTAPGNQSLAYVSPPGQGQQPIPEPVSLTLFGTSILGLAFLRRRVTADA